MGLVLYTAATIDPVDLTTAKAHCRVSTSDDDALISSLISAATEYAQVYTNRQFITATWEYKLPDFPAVYRNSSGTYDERIILPRPRLLTVSSVTYFDSDGTSTVLSSGDYQVNTSEEPGYIVPDVDVSWPSTESGRENAVVVRYTSGYGATAADVPAGIKQAILLLVGNWYENREATVIGTIVADLPFAVKHLLSAYKVPEVV